MSVANYHASVFEHIQILVSVHYASNTSEGLVKFLQEKLNQHKKLIINDAGCAINVRYKADASAENSTWGAFQAHRQVLGLIFVAEAVSPMEAALVQDKFNKKKEEYGPGLYHSRCLIFGVDTIRHSHNQDVFRFSSHEAWKSADYDIKQMITSIFYDLESKRLKMTLEKNARPPLIRAVFESSDTDVDKFEPESKNYRKRCIGRHHKHLADINLLAGQLLEALLCYHSAIDILSSVNDTVWIGAALEGLCIASAHVSFPESPEKKPAQDVSLSQVLDPRNLVNKRMSAPNPGELRKLCIPTIDDLVDRYKEAIIHYSRSKSLGIVEMEACIKATKVVAKAKKYLEASEFLQNAVYITLNLPDDERIKRYSVLADLYDGVGFGRKSSFYKRVAAMQCVAPQLKDPDWKLCNSLLMKSLNGYRINLEDDCGDTKSADANYGWPNVRLRVLHELVFSSEKIGSHKLANRHMMFLLIKMFSHLTETEEKDVCTALENFLRKNKDLGDNVWEMAGGKLPDLALYILPVMKDVVPLSLADEAKPVKADRGVEPESVFIYKPTSYTVQSQSLKSTSFTWCVNTACTINIVLCNPLAYSALHISSVTLMTDAPTGTLYCQPLAVSIPPNQDKEVNLLATPTSSGTMRIIGYEIIVFGFLSKCYFEKIPDLPFDVINVEVIQELPLLRCISVSQAPTEKAVSLTVFLGEKYWAVFSLSNVGQCAVKDIKTSLKEKPKEDILMLSPSDVSDKLPLEPNSSMALTVLVEPKSLVDGDKSLRCVLNVRYAGHVTNNAWWRSIDIEVDIEVKVCVTLNELTVQDARTGSHCVVVCEVENHSERKVDVECTTGEKDATVSSVESRSGKKLTVSIEKIPLSSFPLGTVSVEKYCSSHLRSHLKLTWSTQSCDKKDCHSGAINMSKPLSRASICSMLDSPVQCKLWFDSKVVSGGDQIMFDAKLGMPVGVSAKLSNETAEVWDLEIHVEVYQDQCNGYIEYNLTESVLCIGSAKARTHIKPSECWEHECVLVFLRSGSYGVQVSYCITLPGHLAFDGTSPRKRIIYKSETAHVDAC